MNSLREMNLSLTKKKLAKIGCDTIIILTNHTIDELTKVINSLTTSLRERIGYYSPRQARSENIESVVKAGINPRKEEMGVDFSKEDLASIRELAAEIESLIELKEKQLCYLDSLLKKCAPNLLEAAGTEISARLISLAGSLKHLAELPSSTIQVLGAEKALFRHLKSGSRPPKFGVIFAHQSISNAEEKGKAARKLASRISIAVKKDFFSKKQDF